MIFKQNVKIGSEFLQKFVNNAIKSVFCWLFNIRIIKTRLHQIENLNKLLKLLQIKTFVIENCNLNISLI